MNGAKAIIETLIKKGTNITFGFPGGAVIPLFDEFLNYSKQIKNVLVRHEQGAAHAAEAVEAAHATTYVADFPRILQRTHSHMVVFGYEILSVLVIGAIIGLSCIMSCTLSKAASGIDSEYGSFIYSPIT